MFRATFWSVKYWSRKFTEERKEVQPLLDTWYKNHELTIKEQHMAIHHLQQYDSFATLLAGDVEKIMKDAKKRKFRKQFWTNID